MTSNLLLCHYSSDTCPQSVIDSIHRLKVGLGPSTRIINIYPIDISIDANSLFTRRTKLVIHPTLAYSLDALLRFQPLLCKRIQSLTGAKIVLRQDETTACANFVDAAKYLKITHIYGCLSDRYAYSIYGDILHTVVYRKIYTSYLTPRIRELGLRTLQENYSCQLLKNLDLSYVGADNPVSFGSLTIAKYELVDQINSHLRESHFTWSAFNRNPLNPQSLKWQDILLRTKVHLSVPSGGSAFSYWSQSGDNVLISDYICSDKPLDISLAHQLKYLDNVFPYGQLAPRHLEAIVSGCILGVVDVNSPYDMEPLVEGIHYIKIEPDLANLSQTISIFQNQHVRQSFSNNAIQTLLDIDELQECSLYQRLIDDFDSNHKQSSVLYYHSNSFNDLLFGTWLSDQIAPFAISSSINLSDHITGTLEYDEANNLIATLRDTLGKRSLHSNHSSDAPSLDHISTILQTLDFLADALQQSRHVPRSPIKDSHTDEDINLIHTKVISIIGAAFQALQTNEKSRFSPPAIIVVSDYDLLFAAILSKHISGSQVLFYATGLPFRSTSSIDSSLAFFYQSLLSLVYPLLLGIFASTKLLARSMSSCFNIPVLAVLTPAPVNLKLLHSAQIKYQPPALSYSHCSDTHTLNKQSSRIVKSVMLLDQSLTHYLGEVISAWESSPDCHHLYIIPVNMAAYEDVRAYCRRFNCSRFLTEKIHLSDPVSPPELSFKLLNYDIGLFPQIPCDSSCDHQSYLILSLLMSAGLPILPLSLNLSNNTDHFTSPAERSPTRLLSTPLATQLVRLENEDYRYNRAYAFLRRHITHLNWNQQAEPLFSVIKQSLSTVRVASVPPTISTGHVFVSWLRCMLSSIYQKLLFLSSYLLRSS